MDRHNTTWYDGWISCDKKISPNSVRGNSHWLMYSLGHRYVLGESTWWNHNVPTTLDNGANQIAIDVSLDGKNWTELGTMTLNVATGLPIYEGQQGIDFGNVEARYVLITVLTTHGGKCAGISEVKIQSSRSTSIDEEKQYQSCINVEVYPNPFIQNLQVDINAQCGTRSEMYLSDMTGRQVTNHQIITDQTSNTTVNCKDVPSGMFMLHVISGEHHIQHKVVKID
jgi:hypothetical protein